MNAITCLELSILLWLVHVFTQAGFAQPALGLDYLLSPRDQRREPKGVYCARATRALANYVDNFAPFIAADLGLIVTQHAAGWGPAIWIIARIVYLPLYILGVKYARTLAWTVSVVGLVMMLFRLSGL